MITPAWLETFVPKGIVYDIGANVGETVREFAPLADCVYAFEPNPKCFRELRRNTADLENVRLFECGLSNTIGEQRVFTYRHWLLLPVDIEDIRYVNRDYHPGQRSDLKGEFPVFFTTLDQIVRVCPAPDFIKIDVDGMEYAVLDGARDLLTTRQPVLFVEFGVQDMRKRGDNAEDLAALLVGAGYDFVIDITGNPLRATRPMLLQLSDGADHNVNVLCVQRNDSRLGQWDPPPAEWE